MRKFILRTCRQCDNYGCTGRCVANATEEHDFKQRKRRRKKKKRKTESSQLSLFPD